MIDSNLLAQARKNLEKIAFAPMGPSTGAAGPSDQSSAPAGSPPPPQEAQASAGPATGSPQGGVDPNQLMQIIQQPQVQQQLTQMGIQIGPQGPVDQQSGQVIPPEAMAQILQQMGAMPGGSPQGDQAPVASQAPTGGTPLTVEALLQIMPQLLESAKGGRGGSESKADLEDHIDQLQKMIFTIAQKVGVSPAELGLSPEDLGVAPESEVVQPEVEEDGGQPPFSDEAMSAISEPQGNAPPSEPQTMPPPQAVPPAMQVQASERPIKRQHPAIRVMGLISQLRNAK